jgi:hypothetical protein
LHIGLKAIETVFTIGVVSRLSSQLDNVDSGIHRLTAVTDLNR